jgi:two-component system chemotaxis sensor kinase CheA
MIGKRLSRQLKSIFGDDHVVERLLECQSSVASVTDEKARTNLINFIENLPAFFSSVEVYYEQLDDRASLAQKNMEMSSQELAENNARLVQLNQMFETMVNSLGQGFFIFDRDGFCLPIYSKACETLLDRSPAGIHVSEALGVPADRRETFNDWVKILFDDLIDFEDMVEVGPKSYPSSQGRIVTLEYKPVRNREGHLHMVVVIATDRTAEMRAKIEAQKNLAFATLMVNIIKDKDRFRRFVSAVRQIFRETYLALNRPELTHESLAEVKRHLHTLKGAAGAFGAVQVQDAVHILESKLSAENDLRVLRAVLTRAVPEIDHTFESMLDDHRDILSEVLVEKVPSRSIPIVTLEEFGERLKAMGQGAQNLYRDFVDEVIAVPMRRIFAEFDPVIQQVADKLGKRVDQIKFIGDEVSVMPESMDAFRSALIHVFRNIVDHGIEHEIIRDQRGKVAAGQVVVEFRRLASERGPYLRIIISDDGNGIDIWQIRTKMEKRGETTAGLSSGQLLLKIFDAGFSTASAVTEFSGRGVGLDAVKTEVERLGGTINVRSDLGKGSAFVIELPLDETSGMPQLRPKIAAA